MFPELVTLRDDDHTYWHVNGTKYESLSRVRSCIKPHFEKDFLSRKTAEKQGLSQAEVLAAWDKKAKDACDHGTRIHKALELYQLTGKINPEDEDLRQMVIAVSAEYKDYYMVHNEKTLYDEEYLIAGTADKIMETTKHRNSIVDLDDYKTNLSKGIYYTNTYKKYLLGPFEHVQDTNYFDYCLQLSAYGYMIEKLTGRRIGKLTITFIPPSNPLAYRKIPVPYLKNDVIILFKYYKELKHIKKEEGLSEKSDIILPNFN